MPAAVPGQQVLSTLLQHGLFAKAAVRAGRGSAALIAGQQEASSLLQQGRFAKLAVAGRAMPAAAAGQQVLLTMLQHWGPPEDQVGRSSAAGVTGAGQKTAKTMKRLMRLLRIWDAMIVGR